MDQEQIEYILLSLMERVSYLEERDQNERTELRNEFRNAIKRTEDFFNDEIGPSLSELRSELKTSNENLTRLVTIIKEDLPPDNRLYLELYKMGLIKDDDPK